MLFWSGNTVYSSDTGTVTGLSLLIILTFIEENKSDDEKTGFYMCARIQVKQKLINPLSCYYDFFLLVQFQDVCYLCNK